MTTIAPLELLALTHPTANHADVVSCAAKLRDSFIAAVDPRRSSRFPGARRLRVCIVVRRPDEPPADTVRLLIAVANVASDSSLTVGLNLGRVVAADWRADLERAPMETDGIPAVPVSWVNALSWLHVPERGDLSGAVRWAQSGFFGQSAPIVSSAVHDPAAVSARLATGADRVVLSPFFATPSKPGASPLGLRALQTVPSEQRRHVVAQGGIDAQNLHEVVGEGVGGISCQRAAWEDAGRLWLREAARACLQHRAP